MIRTRAMTARLIGTVAFVASAEDPIAEPESKPLPQVALDDLLGLPSDYEVLVQRRLGATAVEWRERFAVARKQIEDAKQRLSKAEEELDQVSQVSSAWQVAPPGSSNPQNSPLSLRLRGDVKSHRKSVESGERELRALEVEAALASVPHEWRQ